ncbi:MAG: peptide-binding protein [Desulfobulbaceae bacterium DB1]|nr:MAG: peptide-binding protein [Desulfobulbaceae bacterium DB1]
MSKKIILFFSFLLLFVPSLTAAKMVTVAGNELNMRTGPSDTNEVKWVLGKGFPLQVLGSQGKWLKVKDFENDVGWVYGPLTSATPHAVVKIKIVNIRSGPGKKYKLIGQAKYGVVFRVLKKTPQWVQVRHDESGKSGWISRNLLWGL